MTDRKTAPQSVTKIDTALRKQMQRMTLATSDDERAAALNEITDLKGQRFKATRTRQFDRMLTALR